MQFVDRERETAALERFWADSRAQCIPIVGRRRVGKTYLLEHFATGKRVVYHRCRLQGTQEQLARLGESLAELSQDALVRAQPPTSLVAVFALVERLTIEGRLLLIVDEIPYWVARDESLPSVLQNWWDERGRHLDLMLVLCGSAVQMMEKLFTGEAPLAGCVTGRVPVGPFDFRAASEMLGFGDPLDALTAYGIVGGVPLYLSFFSPARSMRANVLDAILSTTSRLYVEPAAVFAAHHESYSAENALAVLRAIAHRNHHWSDILRASKLPSASSLGNVMERLIGDLGLVARVLPVTEERESKTYRTQYRLTDNFFLFWFRFVEPNQGHLEFGDAERVADAVVAALSDHMGPVFEAICRDWVRLASAAGALPVRVGRVGRWWNVDHDLDVVGLDDRGQVALAGECKWTNARFNVPELRTYLRHLTAIEAPVSPEVMHTLFCKSGFDDDVKEWAADHRARLLTPDDLLAPFPA